jgi:hypothetical protein
MTLGLPPHRAHGGHAHLGQMQRFGAPSRLVTIGRVNALMVFKTVCGSCPATAATCLVGTREWVAKQDHPAHIPRPGRGGRLTASVMTLFPSGFAGPRLLGGHFVRSGA